MKKQLSVKDLLSIDMYLDMRDEDEDEEMRWIPLFIRTPKGIECQFGQRNDILSNAKLRINETPNDCRLGDK